MKKVILAVIVMTCFIAGSAMANMCDFYQWKPCYAKKVQVAKPAPAPEKIVLEGVYFDTGSAKIKPESYAVLDANAAKVMKKKSIDVQVVGYTDSVGKQASNMKLSEARAASVKEYLISKGVNANRISSKGMGPADPIADNNTKEGRAKNRRIELVMTK